MQVRIHTYFLKLVVFGLWLFVVRQFCRAANPFFLPRVRQHFGISPHLFFPQLLQFVACTLGFIYIPLLFGGTCALHYIFIRWILIEWMILPSSYFEKCARDALACESDGFLPADILDLEIILTILLQRERVYHALVGSFLWHADCDVQHVGGCCAVLARGE